ncbi:hypothetical protein BJ944DRAFT_266006 [Cunninghamella echinulata]|nr:hypothetical protein BJ944DRAFT_266006 [Cunninghamella echinulata]
MYHHLSQQNPTLTHRPINFDSSKIHPAFGTIQPMIPQRHLQHQQQRSMQHLPTYPTSTTITNNNRIQPDQFDAATNSPIFYGYVSMQSLPPLGPKF